MWVTIELPSATNDFVNSLINKGYDISAAAGSGELILASDSKVCGILALKIVGEDIILDSLYNDICSLLIKYNITYYSLIISAFSTNSMWSAGAIINHNLFKTSIKKVIN